MLNRKIYPVFQFIAIIPLYSSSGNLYCFKEEDKALIKSQINQKIEERLDKDKYSRFSIEFSHAIQVKKFIYVPVIFSPKKDSYDDNIGQFPSQYLLEIARISQDQRTKEITISYNKSEYGKSICIPTVIAVCATGYRKIKNRGYYLILNYNAQYGGRNTGITTSFYTLDDKRGCIFDAKISDIANKSAARSIKQAVQAVEKELP